MAADSMNRSLEKREKKEERTEKTTHIAAERVTQRVAHHCHGRAVLIALLVEHSWARRIICER